MIDVLAPQVVQLAAIVAHALDIALDALPAIVPAVGLGVGPVVLIAAAVVLAAVPVVELASEHIVAGAGLVVDRIVKNVAPWGVHSTDFAIAGSVSNWMYLVEMMSFGLVVQEHRCYHSCFPFQGGNVAIWWWNETRAAIAAATIATKRWCATMTRSRLAVRLPQRLDDATLLALKIATTRCCPTMTRPRSEAGLPQHHETTLVAIKILKVVDLKGVSWADRPESTYSEQAPI